MNKSEFNLIITSLTDRIANCRKHLDRIETTDDIKKITIEEAMSLKQFCSYEEPVMTKIAMVDLYHILGMGNLTPAQMSSFVYRMKEYLSYRPRIKAIAKGLDSIFSLPKLPVATSFKLLGLCDLTLTSGEDADAEEASVDDYADAKAAPKVDIDVASMKFSDKLPFHLNDRTLTLDLSRSRAFIDILFQIFKCPMNETNLLRKIKLRVQYAGIDWVSDDGIVAKGIVSSENNYRKLESYFNNYSSIIC